MNSQINYELADIRSPWSNT